MARFASESGRRLSRVLKNINPALTQIEGKLSKASGLHLEATGCRAPIGSICKVDSNGLAVDTEVVGFADGKILMMPLDKLAGMRPDARVSVSDSGFRAAVGNQLIGRIIDGSGNPIDDQGKLHNYPSRLIHADPVNPLKKSRITEPLEIGVKAVDGVLTVGRGQRIGIVAGSGVGKSQLLAMMTQNAGADVVVIGLIGERGREVNTFIEDTLTKDGRKKACVIAVPADETPLKRVRGALLATTVAEYFRDQGKHVLLLMDSLTRYAQAQREIGLATGEPGISGGYTPSVLQALPKLVERAGTLEGSGSITAFYTVLAENDDPDNVIVDTSRAILDGHIVLSRDLAETGLYPAIDIQQSLSRTTIDLQSEETLENITKFRSLFSLYQENAEMIKLGLYQKGSNPQIDQAMEVWPFVREFISQKPGEKISAADASMLLQQIVTLNLRENPE